jgi:hypothetical protein
MKYIFSKYKKKNMFNPNNIPSYMFFRHHNVVCFKNMTSKLVECASEFHIVHEFVFLNYHSFYKNQEHIYI